MTPDEAWKHLLDPARSEIAEAAAVARADYEGLVGDALAMSADADALLRAVAAEPNPEPIPGFRWVEIDGDVFVGRDMGIEYPPGSPAASHPTGPILRGHR